MIAPIEPVIDDDLGLLRCREPRRIDILTAQRAIELFAMSVLPARSREDPDRFDANSSKPVFQFFGDKLGSIV